MKKRLFLVLIPILLVAIFPLYYYLLPQRVDYFLLEPRDFLETLVAAGRVKLAQEVGMAFQVPGIIQTIPVKEGEKVKLGDLLVTLDDALERNQVQLAREELVRAEINLRKLIEYQRKLAQEEYRRAEINRRAAFEQYEQAQLLFQRGTVPEEELKSAQRNWETALSLENSARLNLENIQEGGLGLLEAKNQIEKARLQMIQAEANLRQKSLLAPIEGTVISVLKNPGEFAQAGETVIVLGKNSPQVVINVDERQYKKIQLGMKALVSEQASLEEKVIPASITRIAQTIDSSQGTVEVTLSLDDMVNMKPDAAVNVEIILREEKEIMALPRRYLSFQEGQAIVWTEKEGKAYPIPLLNPEYLNDWVKTTELSAGMVLLNPKGLRKGKRVVLGERRNN